MTKETEQFEDATSVDPTVDQQELARQAFMRQELAEREELVKQMTLCFLQKKLEVEIYAEDFRREVLQTLRRRLCGDLNPELLVRLLTTLLKASDRAFLEITRLHSSRLSSGTVLDPPDSILNNDDQDV